MPSPLDRKKKFLLWAALASAIVAADQWTKLIIMEHFRLGDSVEVTSFFNLVRAHNTGAAFSMLADAGGWQHWLFIGIAFAVAVFILIMLWRQSEERMLSLALSLVLGGAIGNLIDRLMHGYVVDFLNFHWANSHFPAFNLADTAICIGAGLIILSELIQIRKHKST